MSINPTAKNINSESSKTGSIVLKRKVPVSNYISVPAAFVKMMNFGDKANVMVKNNKMYISDKLGYFGENSKDLSLSRKNESGYCPKLSAKKFIKSLKEDGTATNLQMQFDKKEKIIIITPLYEKCTFCGSDKSLLSFSDKKICKACFASLIDMYYNNNI
jgi:hypothetical protein